MAIDTFQTLEVIEIMEQYLERNRPPVEIRKELDIGYRIENQSIFVFEIRPAWNNPSEITEMDQAKATYIKSRNLWKVYWLRASGWYPYQPPEMRSLKDFIEEIEQDPFGCFWG